MAVQFPRLGRIRQHHAIEHATIAVLTQRRGRLVSVVGRSDFSGFHIYGPFGPEEVASALEEAMQRLRDGEPHLAVTPFCGTNIAITGTLAGSAALLAAGRDRRQGWSRAMTAAVLATLASPRIGHMAQRYVTTNASIGDIKLLRIHEYTPRAGVKHLKVFLG